MVSCNSERVGHVVLYTAYLLANQIARKPVHISFHIITTHIRFDLERYLLIILWKWQRISINNCVDDLVILIGFSHGSRA